MCTGRVDLSFIFKALANGKDAVIIGGCLPGECHYITEGNYLATSTLHIARRLLQMIGLNPERLRLEYISASQGSKYAEVMNEFSQSMRKLGPVGVSEGIEPEELAARLKTVLDLIPFIKLVERERCRIPVKTVESIAKFFSSDEFEKIFQEQVADKYDSCRIMALLRQKPCQPQEIADALGLTTSRVSELLNLASRQGMTRYDEKQNLIGASYFEHEADYAANGHDQMATAALDNAHIEKALEKYEGQEGALIHVLMEIQEHNKWIPKEMLSIISERLNVPLSRVIQVVSFYKIFCLTPPGQREIHVCTGTACHLKGGSELMNKIAQLIGVDPGTTAADGKLSLAKGNCLGCCTLGPEIIVDGKHHGRVKPEMAEDLLKNYD